jgi:hypothetical protein
MIAAMATPRNTDSDDDEEETYEPEYEPERVQVGTISLEVLTVVPPPIEFMSSLHTRREEISGRQVWTGSMLLAHVLYHHSRNTTSRQVNFEDQR